MKDIFNRLPQEKQEAVLGAFLREFAKNDYETASISAVVKELGIAKGSVYQYFGSKRELYKSLHELAEAEKEKYLVGIDLANFWDFWDYYRELHVQGIKFDLEKPLYSQFLFRVSQDRSNPESEEMLKESFLKSLLHLSELVEKQQESEAINQDFDPQFVATTMIGQGHALKEYLMRVLEIDFADRLDGNTSLYEEEEEKILKYVDQSILFMRNAFN